ncbi:hypothetical protein LINGRAPRIM_LOCUS15 [Linum grandiflorum]
MTSSTTVRLPSFLMMWLSFTAIFKSRGIYYMAYSRHYIDGYLISITPRLLELVLKLPSSGISLFSEAEFDLQNFDAVAVLKRWIPSKTSDSGYAPASKLLDIHCSLHYLITNIFLPRSDVNFAVTPLDSWIISCAICWKNAVGLKR